MRELGAAQGLCDQEEQEGAGDGQLVKFVAAHVAPIRS